MEQGHRVEFGAYAVDVWPEGYHPYGPHPCRWCSTPFTTASGIFGDVLLPNAGLQTLEPAIRVTIYNNPGMIMGGGQMYVFCSEGCVGMFLQERGLINGEF